MLYTQVAYWSVSVAEEYSATQVLISPMCMCFLFMTNNLITAALYTWASLCKSLPGQTRHDPRMEANGKPTIVSWSSCLTDFRFLFKGNDPDYITVYSILGQDVSALKPLDTSTGLVLYSLAIAEDGNQQASNIYGNMMDYAQHRGGLLCTFKVFRVYTVLLNCKNIQVKFICVL